MKYLLDLWYNILLLFRFKLPNIMVRDGNILHWDRSRLPIDVYYTRMAAHYKSHIIDVVREINETIGLKLLLYPDSAWNDLVESFHEGGARRDIIAGVILVDATFLPMDNFGETTISYNNVSGEIYNAHMMLPYDTRDKKFMHVVIMHEMCHALGLDHDNAEHSLMQEVITTPDVKMTTRIINMLRYRYG